MTTATWWTLGVAIVACCGMMLASYVSSPLRGQRRQLWRSEMPALIDIAGLAGERRAAMQDRVGEPFTTDCPKCGVLDAHWIREPILGGEPVYDPGHIKVVRVCTKCDHTWGPQS